METYTCKVCERTFPTGRSLGGHMRSHVVLPSSFNPEENSGYTLREYRKKSWRFDEEARDSRSDDRDEKMEIRTESDVPRGRRWRRRSKLVQSISNSSSSSSCSSPEYGALCLMMLSRGLCLASDEDDAKRSESDILRIGIKKVDSNFSDSGFFVEVDEAEFKNDGKRRKFEKDESFRKRNKYECAVCNKSFHSFQALGGHCASHKKIKADSSSVSSSILDQINSQKSRDYQCPICEKVFTSGQGLGGHKRSHLIAGRSSAVFAEVTEIEKKNSKLNSPDLNFPASDCGIYDSFDSDVSIENDKFGAFQGSSRLFDIHDLKRSAEMKYCFS